MRLQCWRRSFWLPVTRVTPTLPSAWTSHLLSWLLLPGVLAVASSMSLYWCGKMHYLWRYILTFVHFKSNSTLFRFNPVTEIKFNQCFNVFLICIFEFCTFMLFWPSISPVTTRSCPALSELTDLFLSFSNYIWVWAYLVLGFRQWVLQLRIRKTVLSAGSRPATALMRGQGPSLGAPGPLGGLPWLCFGTQDIPRPLLSPPTLMSQRVSWLLQLRTSTIQPCSHLPGSGFCFESLYFLLTKKHR